MKNSSAIAKELISIPRQLFIKEIAPSIPCEHPSAAPTPQENSLLNSKHLRLARDETRKEDPPYRLKGEFLKTEEQYERLRNAVSKAARQYAFKLERGVKIEARNSRDNGKRSLMNTLGPMNSTVESNSSRRVLRNNFVSLN